MLTESNFPLAGRKVLVTGGNGFIGSAIGGGLVNVGTATITDTLFEHNEARGGSGNRGDGISFQFVGTAIGGGIATLAGTTSGAPVPDDGTSGHHTQR